MAAHARSVPVPSPPASSPPGSSPPAVSAPASTVPPVTHAEPIPLGALVRPLAVLAGVLSASALVAGLLAPPDAVQGQWQRLMYLHVPAAWTAYLAFAAVLVAGLRQWRRDSPAAARWGRAAAETGVVATAVTLVVGSVWGHAVWGVWWAWDARLVSTALMLLIYVGYLAVAAMDGDPRQVRRRAAVVGVTGFAIVPVVHFSVVWWTTLHQRATILAPPTSAPPIDPRMAVALALSVVAATALGLLAVVVRAQGARR